MYRMDNDRQRTRRINTISDKHWSTSITMVTIYIYIYIYDHGIGNILGLHARTNFLFDFQTSQNSVPPKKYYSDFIGEFEF